MSLLKRFVFTMSVSLITLISMTYAINASAQVVWTAVFSHFTPIQKGITRNYCESHTPSVIVTTIKQITSKAGVTGLNGVNIRYLSYKTVEKDHLYFNIVNAIVRTKTDHGKHILSEPMKLYEQTLAPIGVTNTVWSTPQCKGTFVGTPTVVR